MLEGWSKLLRVNSKQECCVDHLSWHHKPGIGVSRLSPDRSYLAYFGKFIRRKRFWKRGSERKLSILRSALKKYGRSEGLSRYAFSKYSKALSFSPKLA